VTITGLTTIGRDNIFHPTASLAARLRIANTRASPRDWKSGTTISSREHVTIHIGTERGGRRDRVGQQQHADGQCHLGHDVQMAPTASWPTTA